MLRFFTTPGNHVEKLSFQNWQANGYELFCLTGRATIDILPWNWIQRWPSPWKEQVRNLTRIRIVERFLAVGTWFQLWVTVSSIRNWLRRNVLSVSPAWLFECDDAKTTAITLSWGGKFRRWVAFMPTLETESLLSFFRLRRGITRNIACIAGITFHI